MDGTLVLGGDIGGSNTRVVVADADGRVLGRGRAGGGNPVSNPATAAAALAEAAGAALAGLDPGRVGSAVLGLAGGGALADDGVRRSFEAAWTSVGLTWPPVLASDLEVAFAAGSEEPSGRVLIAGTGAVAGRVEEHRLVATADGIGWLLGDEGSGMWLGRHALRAAVRELRHGRRGRLVDALLDWAAVPADSGDPARAVVHAAYLSEPVTLAGLAPVVLDAERAGDPVAVALCEEAVDALLRTLAEVGNGARAGVVVLAGGLSRAETPVGARLVRRLTGEPRADGVHDLRGVHEVHGVREVRHATDEVLGAVRLARRALRD